MEHSPVLRPKQDSGITAAVLHIFAMAMMLCDHLWAMLFPAAEWLTCLGRLAFPVFAFMLAEGYFHTKFPCHSWHHDK